MYMYKDICVIMCKYNSHMSRNIQYNCIQLSTGKLLEVQLLHAVKTDSDQYIIR